MKVTKNRVFIFMIADHKKKPLFFTTQKIVGSERINKMALSADDDKRIILEDRIHTLAYGYRGIKHVGARRLNGGIVGKDF